MSRDRTDAERLEALKALARAIERVHLDSEHEEFRDRPLVARWLRAAEALLHGAVASKDDLTALETFEQDVFKCFALPVPETYEEAKACLAFIETDAGLQKRINGLTYATTR